MHRMVRGSVALLLGAAVVMAGPGALAQETTTSSSTTTTAAPPPGWKITVTPPVVDVPKEKVTLAGSGFPDAIGCKFGSIFATLPGQALVDAELLLKGDFDAPWTTQVDRWEDRTYFTEGVYDLTMSCTDESGNQATYPTGATLTVLASGVPEPDPVVTEPTEPTTTTTQPSTVGTVEPSTARAGETTVTLRGNGFKASTKLDISLKSSTRVTALGTVNALANGNYAATILIPATAPAGKQKVLVTGLGPDDVVRSTSADLLVLAASGTGTATRTRSAAAGGTAATLPATGPTERTPYFLMAGLTAMTLGAFLVGMSHPAEPARGRHRRRRGRHLR